MMTSDSEERRGEGQESEPRTLGAASFIFVLAGLLAGCASPPAAPLNQPIETMVLPWGPFARQCDTTRLTHATIRWRVGETQEADVYQTCAGFSAIPTGGQAAEITASVASADRPDTPVVLRLLRTTDGRARLAVAGDNGLLAQGSDQSVAAETLARDIGLSARQVINPDDTLSLPLRLSLPFPVDTALACRPDGQRRDHGRDTLVLSCTVDQTISNALLDGRLQLAGVEEIDIQTGIRVSSLLTGHLNGRRRTTDTAAWHPANDRLSYKRETELE